MAKTLFNKKQKSFTLQNFLKKNLGGFTLIELLVVISIIGLLTSIVLVSIRGTRGKARDARRITDMQQIFTAQEIVKGEDEEYACIKNDTDGRAAGWNNDCNTNINVIQSKIGKKYLTPFPKDPQDSQRKYQAIDNKDERKKFCVYATIETARTGCDPRYFVASGRGVGEVCNTAPTNLDDCGL